MDHCVEFICIYAKGYKTSCAKKEKESLTERSSGPGDEGENKKNLSSILLVKCMLNCVEVRAEL